MQISSFIQVIGLLAVGTAALPIPGGHHHDCSSISKIFSRSEDGNANSSFSCEICKVTEATVRGDKKTYNCKDKPKPDPVNYS